MELKINRFVPTIQVTDLIKAVDFYSQLGMKHDWNWPEEDPTHGSVSSSNYSIMMEKVDSETVIQRADLYFVIEEVEKYHAFLSGVLDEVSSMVKSPYGMLDFSITDPWGHHLVFGQPHGEYVN